MDVTDDGNMRIRESPTSLPIIVSDTEALDALCFVIFRDCPVLSCCQQFARSTCPDQLYIAESLLLPSCFAFD